MKAKSVHAILVGLTFAAIACTPVLSFAAPSGSTDPLVIRLWQDETVSQEVEIAEGRIRNINVPTLTAFFPDKEKSDGTAVIVCPGGGYSGNDFHRHGVLLAERLNREGITVFVLKYRLRPPSNDVINDALADGLRSVRLIRSRSAEFGVNPGRIGMAGYSAGANLALHVASRFDEGDTNAADPIDRVSSRPDFIVLLCPWAGRGEPRSPYMLRKDSPPAFICHAKDDRSAPFSVAQDTADILKELSVPVELHLFETGGHGAFTVGGPPPGGQWPDLFLEWIDRTVF